MRLDVMRYFLAVADEKSISKVSRKYNIPQQSLSSMLQSFSNEIGMPLFEQTGMGLLLTDAGKEVYQYCTAFINDYVILKEKLHPKVVQEKQKVAVISQSSIAQTVLPRWVSALYKYETGVEVKIDIGNSRDVIASVQKEEARIGFILLFEKDEQVYPKLPDDVIFYPIHISRPYFWMSKKNALAQQQTISMQSLEHYSVIQNISTDQEVSNYIYHEVFDLHCPEIQASNIHIILQLLRDNIAVCPDMRIEYGELGYAYLFDQYADIKALPLRAQDNYKLVTGYITKKDAVRKYDLDKILKYI